SRSIFTCLLPPRVTLWSPPWPCTSALGDSTRRYSAGSEKLSPLSNATCSVVLAASRRSSVGQAVISAIAFGVGKFAGFVRQHDRDAVADRIGKSRLFAHKFLPFAVVMQRRLGERADEDFQQFGIGFHQFRLFAS